MTPPGCEISYVVGYEQLDNWTGIETDDSTEEGRFMTGKHVGRSPADVVVIDRGYSYFTVKVRTPDGREVSRRFGRVPANVRLDARLRPPCP